MLGRYAGQEQIRWYRFVPCLINDFGDSLNKLFIVKVTDFNKIPQNMPVVARKPGSNAKSVLPMASLFNELARFKLKVNL